MTPSSSKKKPAHRAVIMDADGLQEALERIAREVIVDTGDCELALIGIKTRGVPLANRLAGIISKIRKCEIPVGILDITLYRDDFRARDKTPIVGVSDIPFEVDGRVLVLVDDVLYTGRTVRAALDSLMDYGRPQTIRLAVLVDRQQRDLPIRGDYIGQEHDTEEGTEILVQVVEVDGEDAVYLVDTPA